MQSLAPKFEVRSLEIANITPDLGPDPGPEEHQEKIAIARGRPPENKVVGIRMEKPPVDFANLARSLGIAGEGPITEPDQIRPAVERALKIIKQEKRPTLVDVYIQTI